MGPAADTLLFDVAVVGAGPGGCAAATTLACSGARVVLIDKSSFPRDKCCGDGLTTGALRQLAALSFDLESVASFTPIDALVARSSSGRVASIPLGDESGTFAGVATRLDLDAALVDHARRAGAELVLENGLEAISLADARVTITLQDGRRIITDHVIAADGAWSPTRRALGGATHGAPKWTAFRAYASNVSDQHPSGCVVLFDDELVPGYRWSFPLPGNRANVGVYVARDERSRGAGLNAAWESTRNDPYLSSLLGPRARFEGPPKAWPIPASLDRAPTALDGRVLFAGDALSSADPFTGEGIAQALSSGRGAAQAVLSRQNVGERYEAFVESTLRREHRIAAALSRVFEHPLAVRLAVAGCTLPGRVQPVTGRWLYEDYPRSSLFRPSRWPVVLKPSTAPYPKMPADARPV